MFPAFLGRSLGAIFALHPSIVSVLFSGIPGIMLLWFLVIAAVYYIGIPLWRFVILPAIVVFVVAIGWPYYVIFILVPWCLRKLFLGTKDPLWHPFKRNEFDSMSREKRIEWAKRHGHEAYFGPYRD